jgi:hypothetical protein
MTNYANPLSPHHMPDRIKALPRDHRGYPMPWFIHRTASSHDFRVIGAGKIEQALALNLCWICGHSLGRNKTFIIGPMCSINRRSAEPPSHYSCAVYAAKLCPFLSKPRMRRNEKDMPEDATPSPGKMVLHNPGVACIWLTRNFRVIPVDNGSLFAIGEPLEVRWLCQGREASRGEVVSAIDKGLRILLDEAQDEGEDAVNALLKALARVRQYLPGDGDGKRHYESPLMRSLIEKDQHERQHAAAGAHR